MDKKNKKVGVFGTIDVTILETRGTKCSHCAATVESLERYTKVKKNSKSQQFEETLSLYIHTKNNFPNTLSIFLTLFYYYYFLYF